MIPNKGEEEFEELELDVLTGHATSMEKTREGCILFFIRDIPLIAIGITLVTLLGKYVVEYIRGF